MVEPFNKENVEAVFAHKSEWVKLYRKTSLTKAIRIDGTFTVETSEGFLTCRDGYLAMDIRGYPYPIAADEFEMIYEEVEEYNETSG